MSEMLFGESDRPRNLELGNFILSQECFKDSLGLVVANLGCYLVFVHDFFKADLYPPRLIPQSCLFDMNKQMDFSGHGFIEKKKEK